MARWRPDPRSSQAGRERNPHRNERGDHHELPDDRDAHPAHPSDDQRQWEQSHGHERRLTYRQRPQDHNATVGETIVRPSCATKGQPVTSSQLLLVIAEAQLVVVLGVLGPRMPVHWHPWAAYVSVGATCGLAVAAVLV